MVYQRKNYMTQFAAQCKILIYNVLTKCSAKSIVEVRKGREKEVYDFGYN